VLRQVTYNIWNTILYLIHLISLKLSKLLQLNSHVQNSTINNIQQQKNDLI